MSTTQAILGFTRLARLIGIGSRFFSKTISKPKRYCLSCGKKSRHRVVEPAECMFLTCNDCHLTQPLGPLGFTSVSHGGPTPVEMLISAARETYRDSHHPVTVVTFLTVSEFGNDVESTLALLREAFGFGDAALEDARRTGRAEWWVDGDLPPAVAANMDAYFTLIRGRLEIEPNTVNLEKALQALSATCSEPSNLDEITTATWQFFEYVCVLIAFRTPDNAVRLALLNRVDEYGLGVGAQWQKWQHPGMGRWFGKSRNMPSVMPSSRVGRYACVLLPQTTETELEAAVTYAVTREAGWFRLMLLLLDALERFQSTHTSP